MRIEREIVSKRERNWRLESARLTTNVGREKSPRDRLLKPKLMLMCHNVYGDALRNRNSIVIAIACQRVNGPERLASSSSAEQQQLV